jgi:hypothetical protein
MLDEDEVLRILDKQTLLDQIKGLRLDYLGFGFENRGRPCASLRVA